MERTGRPVKSHALGERDTHLRSIDRHWSCKGPGIRTLTKLNCKGPQCIGHLYEKYEERLLIFVETHIVKSGCSQIICQGDIFCARKCPQTTVRWRPELLAPGYIIWLVGAGFMQLHTPSPWTLSIPPFAPNQWPGSVLFSSQPRIQWNALRVTVAPKIMHKVSCLNFRIMLMFSFSVKTTFGLAT